MSELLEEARERRDKAELSTESPSYNWLNDSYYLGEQNAWQEAVDLIEKHEKPKGLMQYVRPPHYREFPPLEYSTNFWALKYRILSYVEWGKSVIEAREAIEREFRKFHFAELNIELTEEQQEIYSSLMANYKYNLREKAIESLQKTLYDTIILADIVGDINFIPALKKFLSEVEE
ncbi:hypothetical protein [Tetragenococcus halophilus]|uniref:Uncharacterized protein n=1 Tax=Tetragenococcus halophilus TaxID=51669 RepID=A0AB35HMF1_TETHA|nr:hypothetical protein [Tetragenococcus halophilus]MCO8288292.1 hypothetical protein [Tetragenococcus halophilus]MCO8290243.1 hypothetical protein [Tetragenococcus halophilus]MCO8294674.1 hypothetical protein [Tetragenococcus halophilus]MCO8297313.1 hypothetical protein [Tetragenococcus halophilus]